MSQTPVISPGRQRQTSQLYRTPSTSSLSSVAGTVVLTIPKLITMGRGLIHKIEISLAETVLPEKKTLEALRGVSLYVEQTHQAAVQTSHEGEPQTYQNGGARLLIEGAATS